MHPNQNLKVAVVIPTYNGAAYLQEAIQSVQRQNAVVSEILVVDDASHDKSADIAEKLGCRCIRLPENRGVAQARNLGITLASSEFIAFLDQDDRWLPSKVRDQVSFMAEHPEIEFTLTHLQHFLDSGTLPSWAREDWFEKPAPGFTPSTLMVRKTTFLRRGLFATHCISSSDTNWIVQAKHSGAKFEMLPQAHVERRIHAGNVGQDPDLRRELLLEMSRSIQMQRSRAAG